MRLDQENRQSALEAVLGKFKIQSQPVEPSILLEKLGYAQQAIREGTTTTLFQVIEGDAATTKKTDFLLVERPMDVAELLQLGLSRTEAEKLSKQRFAFLMTNLSDAFTPPSLKSKGVREHENVKETLRALLSYGENHLEEILFKTGGMILGATHDEYEYDELTREDTLKSSTTIKSVLLELVDLRPDCKIIFTLGHGGAIDEKKPFESKEKVMGSMFAEISDITADDVLRLLAKAGKLDNNIIIDTSCTGSDEYRAAPTLTKELMQPDSRPTFDLFMPVAANARISKGLGLAYWIHSDQKRFSLSYFGRSKI